MPKWTFASPGTCGRQKWPEIWTAIGEISAAFRRIFTLVQGHRRISICSRSRISDCCAAWILPSNHLDAVDGVLADLLRAMIDQTSRSCATNRRRSAQNGVRQRARTSDSSDGDTAAQIATVLARSLCTSTDTGRGPRPAQPGQPDPWTRCSWPMVSHLIHPGGTGSALWRVGRIARGVHHAGCLAATGDETLKDTDDAFAMRPTPPCKR